MKTTPDLDRFRGCLLGLATGDALGATLKLKRPGTFAPIEDMVGGGPFGLEVGYWAGDTPMALCLAESLIVCRGFDPADQMSRYLRWWREGYLSSTGICFDIGRNTHGLTVCVDACRFLAAIIVGALAGAYKQELLAPRFCLVPGYWDRRPLCPEIDEIAAGSYRRRQPPQIQGAGYVAKSLEAAMWAFYRSDDFREGALKAGNLGEDADTTGAVYGQSAGALYGAAGIPAEWLSRLARREFIQAVADGLYHKGETKGARASQEQQVSRR